VAEHPPAPATSESPAKRRIEEAALKLFAAQGYRGTPVKEIMLACGVTPGALYNHFPSKDDLLRAILTRYGNEFSTMIGEAEEASDQDDPAQRLFNVIAAMARFALVNPEATKVANVDYVELSDKYLAKEIEFRRTNRRRIEKIIEAGVAGGQFVAPTYDGVNETKLVATAMANVAIRLSEAAGPHPGEDIDGLARFHAQLALQMVARRQ
jgi:AcrR family transcriptional regulator